MLIKDTIDRVYAQAKILSLIKRILIGTEDIRPSDMHRIADQIDSMLDEALEIKKQRQKFLFGFPRGVQSILQTRSEDVKHIDLRG